MFAASYYGSTVSFLKALPATLVAETKCFEDKETKSDLQTKYI